jgi:hypothetical protein
MRVKSGSTCLTGVVTVRLAVIVDDQTYIITDAEALCARGAEQPADTVDISNHGLIHVGLVCCVCLKRADDTE